MSSFFEPIPERHATPRAPVPRAWAPPLWDRPSEGTFPTVLGVSRLFDRTDDVALALDQVRVYPNGFQLVVTTFVSPHLPRDLLRGAALSTVMLHASTGTSDAGDASEPGPLMGMRGGMMAPRVGIEFADGGRAGHSLRGTPPARDDAGIPVGPIITMGGGGGSAGQFRWEHWVFPLPPSGPLTVFAEWTAAHIPETSVVIDGDEILRAATQAIVLWS